MSDILKSSDSNRGIKYTCSMCGNDFPKEQMRARRVQWVHMGLGSRVERSRVVAWDCVSCMMEHPDYNRQAVRQAPGNKDWTDGREQQNQKD